MYWHRMVCMPVTVGDVHHMLTKIQDDHTSVFCVNELFTKLGGGIPKQTFYEHSRKVALRGTAHSVIAMPEIP